MRGAPSFPPSLVRLFLGMLLVFGTVAVPVSTQVPGQNVNMISVDKYLQKQNEVDLTISPVNPCHIVGAANDYRTVNNKGLNTDGEIGDSWVGVYVSTDCGDTWLNYIMPGYGQGYTTAADPIARFGPGGGLYISHMQFNRGTNWGRIAIARYFDFNNFEGVPASTYNNTADKDESDPLASPVGYLGTTEVARGSAGQFLDKPAMAVVPGTGQACAVTGGRTIPSTDVLVSWTELLSKSDIVLRTKVYFARYTNCGTTLAAPATKLSEGYPVNQGSVIAVNPANPSLVYVAWRQVATDKTVDAIIFVKSTDGGRTFTKPMAVPYFDGVARQLIASDGTSVPYKPFDQPTTSTTFRTLGYPTMVVDEAGRAYLVISARVGSSTSGIPPTDSATPGASVNLPEARLLVTSTADGVFWETPNLVDPGPAGGPAGHQFMPALAYAGGRLNLTWYDLRYDESKVFKAFADEKDVILAPGIRHTLDVRGAQVAVPPTSAWAWPLNFQVYGVSDIGDDKQKVSLFYAQNGTTPGVQMNFNPANLKLYAGGTRPFMGDYIGTAGLQYVPIDTGGWKFNDATAALNNTVLRTFHTAWTDNRDAIVGAAGYPGQPAKNPDLDYVAPGTASGCVIGDASTPESRAAFAKANSRNANIYTSRITPGLFLSALGNTKPSTIERAFAIQVENGTALDMTVHLSITSSADASFVQPASSVVKVMDVTIGKFSSTARTVYVAGAAVTPRIEVVAEQTNGNPNLRAAIVLNGDPVSALVQPGNGSEPVVDNDTHNPRVENPRVENPRVENTSVKNPRVENPRVENPRVENPRVENTTVETPRVENPRVENPRVENAPYSDITYEVTNDGNTTSAFDLDLRTSTPTAGYEFQLIAWRGYKLPLVGPDCKLTYKEDPQVLINEPLLPSEFGYFGLPANKRASVVIRPGETISWTLRAYDIEGTFTPFCTDPVEAAGVNDCNHKLTAEVGAQAINTGMTAASTDTTRGGGSGFSIVDPALPLLPAAEGSPYSVQFNVIGGTGAIDWSSVELPTGLSVSPTGVVSGTPEVFGTYTFGLTAKDSSTPEPRTDSRTFSITIAPQLLITTPALALAEVGFPYPPQVFAATGGTQPYGWTCGGTLPAGLTWSAACAISGTPTARVPTTVSVTVMDAGPPVQSVTRTYTLDFSSLPLTYVVTTEANSGAGSLREAITYANANYAIRDVITFNIQPAGTHRITVSALLPTLTDSVVIDGTTQPGYTTSPDITPVIELFGGSVTGAPTGLTLTGGNSVVRGLVINGFGGAGILLTAAIGGNHIEGNFIGTNVAGNAAVSNGDGVRVASPNNTIGGIWPARNVISGNTGAGVSISGSGNFVQGNNIGLDRSGLQVIPVGASTQSYGVVVINGANNTIGGLDWANRNLISGNGTGINISGAGATGNRVRGNYIGTDANSYIARPNQFGVYVTGSASGNTIGGAGSADWNVISGNSIHGLWINGAAVGNVVQGNHIGAGFDGVSSVPNGGNGIAIGCAGTCTPSPDTSNGNTIGGTAAGQGNTIAFNGSEGIFVRSGVGNRISGNSIFSNGNLGIDLIPQGMSPNDVDDVDDGPNGLQNYPEILSVDSTTHPGFTYIQLTLNSRINPPDFRYYDLQFFANTNCAAPTPQAERFFFGTATGTLNDPTMRIVVSWPEVLPVGAGVTVTATGLEGTSEISPCYTIQAATSPSGTGLTAPALVTRGAVFHLIMNVTPGQNPTSTGLRVRADASALGLSSTLSLNDAGVGCDDISGDDTFIGCATAAQSTPYGVYVLPVTISDDQGRTTSSSITVTVSGDATGRITGTLTDATGAPLAGFNVTIRDTATGAVHAVATGASGEFLFAGLQSDIYEITSPVTRTGIVLHPGEFLNLGSIGP